MMTFTTHILRGADRGWDRLQVAVKDYSCVNICSERYKRRVLRERGATRACISPASVRGKDVKMLLQHRQTGLVSL